MEKFITALNDSDNRKRLATGGELLKYLSDPANSVVCDNIGDLIDGLVSWISCSNFKISQNGLDVLSLLGERMGVAVLKDYAPCILPCIINRFGDSKEVVRTKCHSVLFDLTTKGALSQHEVVEKLTLLFTNKNSYSREGALIFFSSILNAQIASEMTIRVVLPHVIVLFSDSNAAVRENAKRVILAIYIQIGDEVRVEIEKNKKRLPESRLSILMGELDQIKQSGGILASARKKEDSGGGCTKKSHSTTQPPKRAMKSQTTFSSKQHTSLNECKSIPLNSSTKTPSSKIVPSSSSNKKITNLNNKSSKKQLVGNTSAGAVDERFFLKSFEEVSRISKQITLKEFAEGMKKAIATISDLSVDWEKQVEALKTVRSYLLAGCHNFNEFPLCALQTSLELSVNNLRSQVVREACVTIAYLSKELTVKFEHSAERLLPNLLSLIANSAKVIATSGIVCIQFIIKHVHSQRLIPVIVNQCSSKSKVIRKSCCDFVKEIVYNWPTQYLERHSDILQGAIRKGITDADGDTRLTSRQAYFGFREHFPKKAETMYKTLDEPQKRALTSLESSNLPSLSSVTTSNSVEKNQSKVFEPIHNIGMSSCKMSTSKTNKEYLPSSKSDTNLEVNETTNFNDNITIRKHRIVSTPLEKPSVTKFGSVNIVPKVTSKSQRNSRSCSPSHKVKTFDSIMKSLRPSVKYNKQPSAAPTVTTGPIKNLFPCENGVNKLTVEESSSASMNYEIDVTEITQNSKETAPSSCKEQISNIESDQTRQIDSDEVQCVDDETIDINYIVEKCGTKDLNDIKEALESLKTYIQEGKALKPSELTKLKGLFINMFSTAGTKLSGPFYTTLDVFIANHYTQLNSWFHTLISNLLNKLGENIPDSADFKINKCFDTIIKNFPMKLQFTSVFSYIVSNLDVKERVKIGVCDFINRLIAENGIDFDFPQSDSDKGFDIITVGLTVVISWAADSNSGEMSPLSRAAVNVLVKFFTLNRPQIKKQFRQLTKQSQIVVASIIDKHRVQMLTDSSGADLPACSESVEDSSFYETDREFSNPALSPLNNSEHSMSDQFLDASQEGCLNNTPQSSSDEKDRTCIGYLNTDNLTSENMKNNKSELNSLGGVNSNNRDRSPVFFFQAVKNENTNNRSTKLLDGIDIKETIELLKFSTVNKDRMVSGVDKITAFKKLVQELHSCSFSVVQENFKPLLKLLLSQLGNDDPTTNILVLDGLTEMMNKGTIVEMFDNYVELIVLKVLQAFKDRTSHVESSALRCMKMMAKKLTPGLVIRVLVPLIVNAEFPINFNAIRTLRDIIKTHDPTLIRPYLDYVFPTLTQAYDNEESSVRKSALTCLVTLNSVFGADEVRPYLSLLHDSKLKLFEMYVQQEKYKTVPKKCS